MKTRGGTAGLIIGLAAMAAAVTVTGCGNGTASSATGTTPGTPAASVASPSSAAPTAGSSAGKTPTATAASTSSATQPASTAPASPAQGAAPHTATPGGAPTCTTTDLRVSLGLAQGAAGSVYQNIEFTNTTSQPCSMYGYPGVSLLGGTPASQLGAAAQRSQQTAPTLVTLAAGGTATALLRITQAGNYPPSTCDPATATTMQIYPPNQTAAVLLPYKSTGCRSDTVKLLTIGVIQAGTGG